MSLQVSRIVPLMTDFSIRIIILSSHRLFAKLLLKGRSLRFRLTLPMKLFSSTSLVLKQIFTYFVILNIAHIRECEYILCKCQAVTEKLEVHITTMSKTACFSD